jgi:hypothetical protein
MKRTGQSGANRGSKASQQLPRPAGVIIGGKVRAYRSLYFTRHINQYYICPFESYLWFSVVMSWQSSRRLVGMADEIASLRARSCGWGKVMQCEDAQLKGDGGCWHRSIVLAYV